ncbi:MAG: transcription elongation factor GreA, partial [Planctomycetota bacterium]
MNFLTAEEKQTLQEKLDAHKAKRAEITQRIAEARELGDLKENAEYHAAREDQGLNEAEIRRIEERLASSKVVDTGQLPDDMVFVGATVKLRDLSDDEEELFRLVGEATGNDTGDIVEVTVDSPMGEAMLKARVGETIKVDAPRGAIEFEIIEIL